MRKIIFFCVFSVIVFADSVDNMMVQDLKDSKSMESTSQTTQDSKANDIDSNVETLESDVTNLENKIQNLRTNKNNSLKWFIGGYIGTYYNARYNNAQAQILNLSFVGGIFYNVRINHGLRGYAFASYNTIIKTQIFSAGVGADYFYDFKSGFKVFGGAYADFPFSTISTSLAIYGGVGGFLANNHHIELRIGYPLMQDSNLSKSVIIGVMYQYLFGK
ncbi:hypothetical protein DCO58_01355 [Helicobacter saguini]|uniref:Outer membrane beta-barrel protein n=1 Tax=Helicobacter saguini TaxID=1548018 RepID=A0A347VRB0_9HELI|nr:hypothetical protein [Helicobacter saguini]MWV62969.1 hypothetical protein [Helicobacter saguini]MWV66362.1 hypothetical protein [Helicobacter saguini]MWV68714.1 hypothetical protein [Helicobacter saguini]MWV71735.1 hypothetical protein [Helicobacter saguini]TLD92176.1 hypothetical protein LS64_010835 [Helicobacter saguini]